MIIFAPSNCIFFNSVVVTFICLDIFIVYKNPLKSFDFGFLFSCYVFHSLDGTRKVQRFLEILFRSEIFEIFVNALLRENKDKADLFR